MVTVSPGDRDWCPVGDETASCSVPSVAVYEKCTKTQFSRHESEVHSPVVSTPDALSRTAARYFRNVCTVGDAHAEGHHREDQQDEYVTHHRGLSVCRVEEL